MNSIGTGPAATATSTTLGSPGTVTSFKVVRGDKTAKLSWAAPTSDGGSAVTGYVVQRRSYNSTTKLWSAWTSSTVTTTSQSVTGLTNGTRYEFRLAARTNVTTGPNTAAVSVTPAGRPGTSKVTVAAKKGKFILSWTSASNNGSALTAYVVQYTTSGKKWTTLKTIKPNVRKLTTSVGKKGKTYSFRVAAKNAVGTGAYSKVIKAKRK